VDGGFGGHRAAGEQVAAGRRTVVDAATYLVPHRGQSLPFVEEDRAGIAVQLGQVGVEDLVVGAVVQPEHHVGPRLAVAVFPTPLGPSREMAARSGSRSSSSPSTTRRM
jgi:hypothetical protein